MWSGKHGYVAVVPETSQLEKVVYIQAWGSEFTGLDTCLCRGEGSNSISEIRKPFRELEEQHDRVWLDGSVS